jgi:L-asparaginase/beta-aspartyl-peptidase (threonine type)
VARAADGTFAVACSTGGTALMLPGRIGDSPIFGAGVMAGPHGAVCCTGHGEEIIRHLCAARCYQRLEQGEAARSAAEAIVAAFPEPYELGLIVVGRDGHGLAVSGGIMASYALAV